MGLTDRRDGQTESTKPIVPKLINILYLLITLHAHTRFIYISVTLFEIKNAPDYLRVYLKPHSLKSAADDFENV